ncbi:hypothetical protein HMPREF0551_0128 [Lautropia mirabilis ATCC 51599]|uniref:Uncharacterized protein n=1 Tax=Lautropia mirabilis ATCC 51599 TaxID=887898 RepID=E7RUG2_9BURK|nr:hypothetical protein HMPREF0551_0128 [Lautropia mirabilis ATCC 51599]
MAAAQVDDQIFGKGRWHDEYGAAQGNEDAAQHGSRAADEK